MNIPPVTAITQTHLPSVPLDPAVTRGLLESLRDFDTPLIANTIDAVDKTPPEQWYMGGSIKSLTPTIAPTVGVAFTCRADTSSPGTDGPDDDEGYWAQHEQIASLGLPAVWVVQSVGSRPDHACVLGDGMAKALHSVGCVGVVTNGGIRDLRGLMTIPFAAHGRGAIVHHTRMRFFGYNETVEIGGIEIQSGNVIHADAEGVIKLPPDSLPHLVERAAQMRAFEHEVHATWRQTDLSLGQKRDAVQTAVAKYGF